MNYDTELRWVAESLNRIIACLALRSGCREQRGFPGAVDPLPLRGSRIMGAKLGLKVLLLISLQSFLNCYTWLRLWLGAATPERSQISRGTLKSAQRLNKALRLKTSCRLP